MKSASYFCSMHTLKAGTHTLKKKECIKKKLRKMWQTYFLFFKKFDSGWFTVLVR